MGWLVVCLCVCFFVAKVKAPFREAAPREPLSAPVCTPQPYSLWPQALLPQTQLLDLEARVFPFFSFDRPVAFWGDEVRRTLLSKFRGVEFGAVFLPRWGSEELWLGIAQMQGVAGMFLIAKESRNCCNL